MIQTGLEIQRLLRHQMQLAKHMIRAGLGVRKDAERSRRAPYKECCVSKCSSRILLIWAELEVRKNAERSRPFPTKSAASPNVTYETYDTGGVRNTKSAASPNTTCESYDTSGVRKINNRHNLKCSSTPLNPSVLYSVQSPLRLYPLCPKD